MDYHNAQLELARGPNGPRKIGNNTYLYPVDGGIGVRLHGTDVVVIHPDNTYTLNSGGWQTVTTKARINEFSPARVCQRNGVWYVDGFPFVDGMKVDAKGNLFATGPGGVYIFSPEGKLLGRISTGERTSNCAWGDDGSTLYITADMYLCRIKTTTKGAGK